MDATRATERRIGLQMIDRLVNALDQGPGCNRIVFGDEFDFAI